MIYFNNSILDMDPMFANRKYPCIGSKILMLTKVIPILAGLVKIFCCIKLSLKSFTSDTLFPKVI